MGRALHLLTALQDANRAVADTLFLYFIVALLVTLAVLGVEHATGYVPPTMPSRAWLAGCSNATGERNPLCGDAPRPDSPTAPLDRLGREFTARLFGVMVFATMLLSTHLHDNLSGVVAYIGAMALAMGTAKFCSALAEPTTK